MIGKVCPMFVRFPAGNRCYAGQKKIFKVTRRNITGGSMHGLLTIRVAVTDVLTTTWTMMSSLRHRSYHGLPPITTSLRRLAE